MGPGGVKPWPGSIAWENSVRSADEKSLGAPTQSCAQPEASPAASAAAAAAAASTAPLSAAASLPRSLAALAPCPPAQAERRTGGFTSHVPRCQHAKRRALHSLSDFGVQGCGCPRAATSLWRPAQRSSHSRAVHGSPTSACTKWLWRARQRLSTRRQQLVKAAAKSA